MRLSNPGRAGKLIRRRNEFPTEIPRKGPHMRYASACCLCLVLATLAAGPGRALAQVMTAERFQDWYHYNNFGRSALERGDLEKAAKCFRMAIDFARPAVASDPQPLARTYTDLAMVLVKQG